MGACGGQYGTPTPSFSDAGALAVRWRERAHVCQDSPFLLPVGVHDEGVAAVLSAELHHQSELVDPAGSLKERDQLVFVQISRDLPHKDLAAPGGGRAFPA